MVRRRLAYAFTIVAPIAVVACFSSDKPVAAQNDELDATAGDATRPDSSVERDASEAGNSEPLPEASVDGSAPTEAAAPLPDVTLQVVGLHGPKAGVPVFFSDATGALLSAATTDAGGLVEYLAPADAQVTVVLGTVANPSLTTLVGIEPGDFLTAVDATDESFSATFPSIPPSPPGVSYLAFAGSSSESSAAAGQVPTSVYPFFPYGVSLDGKFPVLVLASNLDGTQAGYLSATRNPIATDGGPSIVTFPAGWRTAIATQSVSTTGSGDAGASVGVSFNEVSDEISFVNTTGTLAPSDGGATTTWNFPTHPGYADFVQSEADQTSVNGTFVSTTLVATRQPAPAAAGSVSFDLSKLLPAITGATLDGTDPTRPVLSWTTGAPLTSAIGTFASIAWRETLDGGTNRMGTWVFLAPPSAATIKPPTLPASAPGPGSGATWTLDFTLIASVDNGAIPDYATLRATPGALSQQLARGNPPYLPPFALDRTMRATILQIEPPTE